MQRCPRGRSSWVCIFTALLQDLGGSRLPVATTSANLRLRALPRSVRPAARAGTGDSGAGRTQLGLSDAEREPDLCITYNLAARNARRRAFTACTARSVAPPLLRHREGHRGGGRRRSRHPTPPSGPASLLQGTVTALTVVESPNCLWQPFLGSSLATMSSQNHQGHLAYCTVSAAAAPATWQAAQ